MRFTIIFALLTQVLVFAADGPDLASQKAALEKELGQATEPGKLHMQMSELLEKMGDNDASVEQAKKALGFLDDQAPAHYRLAAALRSKMTKNPMSWMTGKGEYLQHLERAIELDNTFLPAYQEIVGFHLNAPAMIGASKDQAQAFAEKLAVLQPKQGNLLVAQVMQKKGEGDKAIELLKTLHADMPDAPDVNHSLGDLLYSQKRYSEAYVYFDKNIQGTTPKMKSMYQAARARISGEVDMETAISILNRYIELAGPDQSPTAADAHWRKGDAYVLLKKTEQARASFNQALALDAGHNQAKESLAKLEE